MARSDHDTWDAATGVGVGVTVGELFSYAGFNSPDLGTSVGSACAAANFAVFLRATRR